MLIIAASAVVDIMAKSAVVVMGWQRRLERDGLLFYSRRGARPDRCKRLKTVAACGHVSLRVVKKLTISASSCAVRPRLPIWPKVPSGFSNECGDWFSGRANNGWPCRPTYGWG